MAYRRSRRRTSTRSAGRRRKLVWADTIIQVTMITAVTGTDLLAGWRSATGGYQPVGATVRRTLISQRYTIAGTAATGTSIRVGLIAEAATSAAEVPDPVAEPYADWAYNSRFYIGNVGGTGAESFNQPLVMDVRSGRKLDELGTTWWLMLSPELDGATNITGDIHVRTLMALP